MVAVARPSLAALPTKSLRECGQEFKAREQALSENGINAATFYHECWWHSRPGQVTSIAPVPKTNGSRRDIADGSPRQGSRASRKSVHKAIKVAALPRRDVHEAALHPRTEEAPRSATARAEPRGWTRRTEAAKRVRLTDARDRGARRPTRHFLREPRYADLDRRPMRHARLVAKRQERDEEPFESAWGIGEQPMPDPRYALEGRQAWIGADTVLGPRRVAAVIIGPLPTRADGEARLQCWSQGVWFVRRRPHWGRSLVCDEATEPLARQIWPQRFGSL